ncbi:HmuY family protein [Flavobacterium sp. KACC 22761]|uniref:HmuY family protein n=1 Tax=Flavobacterium sp. KACC 22761 TaxID=3092665 RepID=UPI002A74FD37|nr:HmuY family protein [Flavobacterium sp. KACC 22761]WPO79434.1 HmuY family protein [Flavobacterium sp. KACC 22761]
MKKNFALILSFVLLAFTACNSDDDQHSDVAVAFAEASYNLTSDATPVQIKFSKAAPVAGTVTLDVTETAVTYTTDYTTTPAAASKKIVVPFAQGATSVEFTFNKIKNATGTEVKNVVFTISGTSLGAQISGNKTIQLNFNETASLGTALAPEVGGPLEPNQVYVDLSSGKLTSVARNSWDLGFYSGADFRVVLNSSVKMSVKQLTTTNIDEVQVADKTMIISTGAGFSNQVDDSAGDIAKTAIVAISATDSENKVYLLYLGNKPATTAPVLGKEGAVGGDTRGWKKIRVLRSGSDYKVQYADIASTTHDEIVISKNSAYNFTFLSLIDKKVVNVEPQKNQWDLNFTTFVNVIPYGATTVPYFYPDYVTNNLNGNAKAYQVLTSAFTYEAFTLANVDNTKFTADQRNIGSNWRSTSVVGPNGDPVTQFVLRTDRFFVIKDPAGNVYKLKFTGGAKADLERGHPTFQYALLK